MDIVLESMRTQQYFMFNPSKTIYPPWHIKSSNSCTLVKKGKQGVSKLDALSMEECKNHENWTFSK